MVVWLIAFLFLNLALSQVVIAEYLPDLSETFDAARIAYRVQHTISEDRYGNFLSHPAYTAYRRMAFLTDAIKSAESFKGATPWKSYQHLMSTLWSEVFEQDKGQELLLKMSIEELKLRFYIKEVERTKRGETMMKGKLSSK